MPLAGLKPLDKASRVELQAKFFENEQVEIKLTVELSDLDTRDGICGWGLRVMDDLQQFVERRVSITVLEKLEKNYMISTDEMEKQRKIKKLITESVGSAFKEYKDHVDPQHERITELHEEPEHIYEPSDGFNREDAAVAKPITPQASTLSPSNSTVSTDMSEHTDYMSMCFPLLDDSRMISKSPEHIQMLDLPSLSMPSLLELPGLMRPDFAQEYPLLLHNTNYQHGDGQFWPVAPEFCDDEFRNESQDAIDGGSVDFGAAEFQL